jgi:hypothetical protein
MKSLNAKIAFGCRLLDSRDTRIPIPDRTYPTFQVMTSASVIRHF